MTFTPLPQSFYKPNAAIVARRLLGHWLVRRTPEGPCGGIIVETEAYLHDDPSCHGYGRQTPRNRVLYGPPGYSYVYFIYGNHYCFNTVCQAVGCAEAVLVRAIEPTLGEDLMRRLRPVTARQQLTNGPGKLCAALDIGRELDGVNLCDALSPVIIARHPDRDRVIRQRGPTVTTTRIGLSIAAHLPLRFYLAGSEFVSRKGPKTLSRSAKQ
jgi:DNA-3-methyladenine glycosylase